MHEGHFASAGASVEFGEADVLFPVEELDADVLQDRDVELALDAVDGTEVIVVTLTSLATNYELTQRPLTAIRVDSLPTGVREQVDDAIDEIIETFELIQIGKWTVDSANRSLAEFTAS